MEGDRLDLRGGHEDRGEPVIPEILAPGAGIRSFRVFDFNGTLDPLLARLSHIPGVDVEDKGWSVAIHHRHVLPEVVPMLDPLLKELEGTPDVRVFRGPSVAEVQLLRNVSKSFGLRRICRILRKGGIAFSAGGAARAPGAKVVETPVALARAVASLAGLPRQRGKRTSGMEEKSHREGTMKIPSFRRAEYFADPRSRLYDRGGEIPAPGMEVAFCDIGRCMPHARR